MKFKPSKLGQAILGTFVAMLGASFMHQSSAQWLVGGTTSSGRKSHLQDLNLFCDMSAKSFGTRNIELADQVKIVTLPSQANPTATPSLTFEGQMFCAEVDPNEQNPSLQTAAPKDGVPGGVPLVGKFRLLQQAPKLTPQNGLEFVPPPPFDVNNPSAPRVSTWRFFVEANPEYPFPELLYILEPVEPDDKALFCEPSVPNCTALYGLQLPAKQGDYPARDIDGGDNDLTLGEVFKFTTITTTPGTEAPRNWYWGVCHSGHFSKPATQVSVDARNNASHGGVGMAVTGFAPNVGARFAVTVNQNDLWNSGGRTGWSNADGRSQEFRAAPNDDSSITPAGTLIGTIDTLSGDSQHRLWAYGATGWAPANEAARGTLVGSFNGTDFYILGTAFDGLAPATATGNLDLKLYYWDRPRNDNTGSVSVKVATESIQCNNDDPVATVTSGAARGERRVEVDGFPILNVASPSAGAGFPFAVLGCTRADVAITFAPNGSPIDLSQGVLVNNQPVAIESVQVVNNVQRESCDGGQQLADLNLKLNKLDFIRAVTPGGTCQNGPVTYSVALGNGNSGWYGGQDIVDVINCSQ